ncbi:MAG: hypothetical protein HYX47_20485 [Burkholderiales bacterium]|nr:hypothetical protein [Burkholderiales bacterium]
MKSFALALDALEAVTVCPEHVPAWWQMMRFSLPLPPQEKAQIITRVSQLSAGSLQAQWFRHSALYGLTQDAGHLVAQAELAAILPDAQRRMSLALLVWSYALAHVPQRDAFRQLFVDTRQVELLGGLCATLDCAPRPQGPPKTAFRVAILAQQLSTGLHAGTSIAFNLAGLLEGQGFETRIFAAQELTIAAMAGYSACGERMVASVAEPATWPAHWPRGITAVLADAEFSVSARWAQLADALSAYAPDLVLLVGFASPLAWALHRSYPMLGLSLHTLAPLAPVDVWLAADAAAGQSCFWPGLPAPRIAHFPYRFWPAGASAALTRAGTDVPEGAVLLVSCGSRLDQEISEPFAGNMLGFLDANPQVHWLLVGLPDPQRAPMAGKHERIHHVRGQTNLADWIRLADIYLNPPRMGGGTSVAMAMEQALPVVAMEACDGGDKIGALAAPDLDGYFARLSQWVSDPALRKRDGGNLRQAFHDQLDLSNPAAGPQLVRACEQAIECFGLRKAGAREQPALL